MLIKLDRFVHFRDDGLGCLGTYKTLRIAIGPLYISLGWRIQR